MAENFEDLMKGYGDGTIGRPTARHNHTNPQRYHAESAKVAWNRTLEFFKKNLQG